MMTTLVQIFYCLTTINTTTIVSLFPYYRYSCLHYYIFVIMLMATFSIIIVIDFIVISHIIANTALLVLPKLILISNVLLVHTILNIINWIMISIIIITIVPYYYDYYNCYHHHHHVASTPCGGLRAHSDTHGGAGWITLREFIIKRTGATFNESKVGVGRDKARYSG